MQPLGATDGMIIATELPRVGHSFDQVAAALPAPGAEDNRCKSGGETAAPPPKQRDRFPRLRARSAAKVGAGSAFDVKCLFAIDAIAAVYRAGTRISVRPS